MTRVSVSTFALLTALGFLGGCGPADHAGHSTSDHASHDHGHKPPHGGTPVALGQEFHLELSHDPAAGKLTAYVMDAEFEKYIRLPLASFDLAARLPDRSETLRFQAVASQATGETVGDTSMFEASAGWLKTNRTFQASLNELEIRGRRYTNITFEFPKGNEDPHHGHNH